MLFQSLVVLPGDLNVYEILVNEWVNDYITCVFQTDNVKEMLYALN